MNDKTVIRPGGKPPKRDSSVTPMDDDRTEVRTSGASDPNNGAQQPEPDDKTVIRPGGRRARSRDSESKATKDETSAASEPIASAASDTVEDKTVIRPGGNRARRERAEKVDPKVDADKTRFRSSTPSLESDVPAQKEPPDIDELFSELGDLPASAAQTNTQPRRELDADSTITREEFDAQGGSFDADLPSDHREEALSDSTMTREEFDAQGGSFEAGGAALTAQTEDYGDSTITREEFDAQGGSFEASSSPAEAVSDSTITREEFDAQGGSFDRPAAVEQKSDAALKDDRRRGTTGRAQISKETQQFVEGLKPDSVGETAISLVTPLLMAVGQLQSVANHPNINEFREYVIQSIRKFEKLSFGLQGDDVRIMSRACSYGLCAFIDDVLLSTPWGYNSDWSKKTLVQVFHPELAGEDHFFEMLDDMVGKQRSNLPVLEVYYLCLELGYEGKYRELPAGGRTIHDIRNKVFEAIRASSLRTSQALSNRWEGVAEQRGSLFKQIPYWVILACCLGCVVTSYVFFSFRLANDTDITRRALATLSVREPAVIDSDLIRESTLVTGQLEPDLAQSAIGQIAMRSVLAEELRLGLLEVQDYPDKIVLRLNHPEMFRSGTHLISEQFVQVVSTISTHLKDANTRILITGHTDDVPIRSLKYPSNWELSKARADSVKAIMDRFSFVGIVRTRGLADTVNIVPNDSVSNRAINRRVEVVVNK